MERRLKKMFEGIRNPRRIDLEKLILIPGELEAQMERVRREKGIPFEPKVFETLKGLAQGNYNYEIPRL